MPHFDLLFDKGKEPEPGTYFCLDCNAPQKIFVKGQELKPCPKCGGTHFKTV